MDNFKIYSVTDEYIDYLRIIEPNVYSNKVENRIHTRKYIGTVLEMNGYKYFVPMSSPKDTDYQMAGGNRVIRKSIVPIIRMIEKNNGVRELKGTLRISHMIPVPESELILYDLENEEDKDNDDFKVETGGFKDKDGYLEIDLMNNNLNFFEFSMKANFKYYVKLVYDQVQHNYKKEE